MNLKIIILSERSQTKKEFSLYDYIYINFQKKELTYCDAKQQISGGLGGAEKQREGMTKGHEET